MTARTPALLRLRGAEGEIRILRDTWGIAHVQARSTHDAFFGQGFVHAQDRLWQMDAARRRMQGRWAEWIGPSGAAADRLARRLGAHTAGERDYRILRPESQGMLQAYAAGVNAWLGLGRALPPEYALTGDEPEPWQPWHSIDAMRQRGWLMGSLWFKLWRAAALSRLAPEQVLKLRYDDGGVDRLCMPAGADAQRWIASLRELAPAIDAVRALADADATGGGSNNWAIAPSRTATGRPLLAGDPHRQFEMPGMYVQGHVACDAFDAIGLAVPGVPGFPHFGHNGHVAWCVTHAFADLHDLYVERFEGEGDGLTCTFRGEREPVRRRRETLRIRGAADESFDVVETRHGPVVCGEPARGLALVLRSVQVVEADRSFDVLQPSLRARSVQELFEASRGWGLIDHNLVAADTAGHIGHRVRAQVPRRSRLNGWLPVPGWTGEHEWRGMVPWDRMPCIVDPPRGFLVTANNRVQTDDEASGWYQTDCHPPYRAQRIEARLQSLDAAGIDDMAPIHRDTISLTAPVFQRALARLQGLPADAEAWRQAILGWDGRMDADAPAATAYTAFRWQLARLLAERSGLAGAARDPLIALPPGTSPELQLWWCLPSLLRTQDTGLLGGIGWDEACATALTRAAGPLPIQPWGQQHTARLQHPLAALSGQAAQALALPGQGVGGDNDTVLANGCLPASGLQAAYGAVARYAFDVGDWRQCRWIVVDGVDGVPGQPHRLDQHPIWARGEMVPMLYDWGELEAQASSAVRLVPQP